MAATAAWYAGSDVLAAWADVNAVAPLEDRVTSSTYRHKGGDT
jgi:hypothetical protein